MSDEKHSHLIGVSAMIIVSWLHGCGRAAGSSSNTPVASDPVTTVCLQRILLDLPGIPQFAGVDVAKYDGGYGLPGIDSVGTVLPRYIEMKISESHPTDLDGFERMRTGAGEHYRSTLESFNNLSEIDKKIGKLKAEVLEFPADQGFVVRDVLQRNVLDLEWVRAFKERKLKIQEVAGQYSYRFATIFNAGYFDPADRRVRMFEGRPQNSAPSEANLAADELARIRTFYRSRAATEIPSTPGFCTGHGFIAEPMKPEPDTSFASTFRSLSYPNLIFTITIERAWDDGKKGAPAMSRYLPYLLNMVGLRGSEIHGPVEADLAGSPAVIHGMKYNPKCGEKVCVPLEEAYEFSALTYGDPDRIDRPRIELKMVAALPDDYKARRKTEPGHEWSNKVYKPGLRGLSPPPYEVGRKIFECVVKSIRLRPGAFAEGSSLSAASDLPGTGKK